MQFDPGELDRLATKGMVVDGDDFMDWLKGHEDDEAAKIKSVEHWADAVDEFFDTDEEEYGDLLPWTKTHALFQIRPRELTIWAGINGHRKSLLVSQIMLWVGKRTLVCSMEMSPIDTIARMIRQAVGGAKPSKEWRKKFYDHFTDKIFIYDQSGTVDAERLCHVVRYGAEVLKCEQIVVDSLMKIAKTRDDYAAQTEVVNNLQRLAVNHDSHVHLIAHTRKGQDELTQPNKLDVRGAGEITDQADNVWVVWRNKRKEEDRAKNTVEDDELDSLPDTYITCHKQRRAGWEGRIGLWFHEASLQHIPGTNGRAMPLPGFSKQEVVDGPFKQRDENETPW